MLPNDIDGKIPDSNDKEGWLKVLDNPTELCSKFWNNKVYDGFPIEVKTFLSNNPLIDPIKKTHALFKECSNASNNAM